MKGSVKDYVCCCCGLPTGGAVGLGVFSLANTQLRRDQNNAMLERLRAEQEAREAMRRARERNTNESTP